MTQTLYSRLETMLVASKSRRVAYVREGRIEAPNWLPTRGMRRTRLSD